MAEKKSILLAFFLQVYLIGASLVQINVMNHDEIMLTSRLTFVSFTAEWCPYSRQLAGEFKAAATKYGETYPDRKTVWANVDCVGQERLATRYRITKFPTVQIFFYGYMMMEYRGARNVESLMEYLNNFENTEDLVKVQEIGSFLEAQEQLDQRRSSFIIWFPRNSPPYELMLKAVALVHGSVNVLVPKRENDLKTEKHSLTYAQPPDSYEEFKGMISNFNEIANWVKSKTSGLVRELTFLNAEGIIEEAKPLLLLFRDPRDQSIEERYVQAIRRELGTELIEEINPLITDGFMMTFPLQALGLSTDQLPILIIDQFFHTYLAPFRGEDIFLEGNIRKFVKDLKNGNLHRRHHGDKEIADDEETTSAEPNSPEVIDGVKRVESVFKRLEPAKKRYSFAKEEL